jgi:WD40 repeat protein
MAEPPPDYEQAPVPAGTRGGARRRLGLAVAVTLVGAVVVVAAIQAVGLVARTGNAAVAPSASAAAAESAAAPESSATAASPEPSVPPASFAPLRPPTSPGLIAVVDDSGALSTMDDGGGSVVRYPAPGVVFGFPAWSPDGSRIAVVGQNAGYAAIYVFTVPKGDVRYPDPIPKPVVIYRSADRPPFYLYWTPNGDAVAFLATEATEISLRIAPADGSAPVDGSGPNSIIRTGAPLYFDWVKADRLLLHVGLGSEAFVGEVGLDGASVRPALPGTGEFRAASVSRDGRYLAYVRSKADTSSELVVASPDGKTSHELPFFGPAAFVFDPTSDTLAAIAAEAPVDPALGVPIGPLRLIDSRTGTVRTLLDRSVVAFFWSPDGTSIAAIRLAEPGDDQVTAGAGVVLAGAAVPRPSTGNAVQAPGIVVRLTFADMSTGLVGPDRVVRLADHFVGQLLAYFDQYALSHSLWSPDSASILLPLVDASGRDQVVVVPADGSAPRPIAGGAKGFWSP